MPNRYFPPSTLPFDPDGENLKIIEEFAHPDVVESPVAWSARADLERIVEPGEVQAATVVSTGDGHPDEQEYASFYHDGEDSRDSSRQGPGDDRSSFGPVESVNTDTGGDGGAKRRLLQSERFDRESHRALRRRQSDERSRVGQTDRFLRIGRHSSPGTRDLAVRLGRNDEPESALRRPVKRGARHSRGRSESDVPVRGPSERHHKLDQLAIDTQIVRRRLAGPLNGTALAIYFLLLPYVVVTRWGFGANPGHRLMLRVLLVILGVFWSALFVQMLRNIGRVRRGLPLGIGGSAWLAGLIVAAVSLVSPTGPAPPRHDHRSTNAPASTILSPGMVPERSRVAGEAPKRPAPTSPIASVSMIPLALMAKRRSDLLRQHQFTNTSQDVDRTIELLRGLRPELIARVRQMIGQRLSGVIDCPSDGESGDVLLNEEPCVACFLGPTSTGSLIGFSREGGRLPVRTDWSDEEIRDSVVALHNGKIVFTSSTDELIRALAVRSVHQTLVVHIGSAAGLDGDLAASCVTVVALPTHDSSDVAPLGGETGGTIMSTTSFPIRVNILRSDPSVVGLSEPFTPTLRRRSLEMLAYLALHRKEPVTGDRIRTRVLTYADVDASTRTLANTASSLRRSLGSDAQGTRLHAVTSTGLYVTHGVSSDFEVFSNLVARARRLSLVEAAPLARQALALINGEPLASALRGYEWFLAEGFGARLSRDGEWSALLVHHQAIEHDQFELAFWALQQGLLIDPYSTVLLEALAKVPRLRQFGRDRSDVAQDQPVSPGGAVAMSWSLNGLRNQITK